MRIAEFDPGEDFADLSTLGSSTLMLEMARIDR